MVSGYYLLLAYLGLRGVVVLFIGRYLGGYGGFFEYRLWLFGFAVFKSSFSFI